MFFHSQIAEKYGLDEAVMLQNVWFWIKKNEANGRHLYDGRTWTYNTINAWSKLFPFWSEYQIKRLLKKMTSDGGPLIEGCYNHSPMDRTKWYALSNDAIRLMHCAESPIARCEIAPAIPDINTDINTDDMPTSEKTAEKDEGGEARELIIGTLNERLGTSYRSTTKGTVEALNARLKEYSVDDLVLMVKHRVFVWSQDDKMRQYLTPETLFRPGNCEKYVNAMKVELAKRKAQKTKTAPLVEPQYYTSPEEKEYHEERVRAMYAAENAFGRGEDDEEEDGE